MEPDVLFSFRSGDLRFFLIWDALQSLLGFHLQHSSGLFYSFFFLSEKMWKVVKIPLQTHERWQRNKSWIQGREMMARMTERAGEC